MRTALPPATGRPWALPALSIAIAVTFVLGGCTPHDSVITPPSAPVVEPVFASDEEALAAATEAYRHYLEVSDQIGHDGGANPERLEESAVGDALETSRAEFKSFAERGLTSSGDSALGKVTLQSYDLAVDEGTDVVLIYACLDITEVDVVDSSGSSIVSPDRNNIQMMEVGFDILLGSHLLVSHIEPWGGAVAC